MISFIYQPTSNSPARLIEAVETTPYTYRVHDLSKRYRNRHYRTMSKSMFHTSYPVHKRTPVSDHYLAGVDDAVLDFHTTRYGPLELNPDYLAGYHATYTLLTQ